MARRGKFAAHTFRVGGRVGDRAKRFVKDARTNTYNAGRLAEDVAASALDVADFWSGLFGTGSSAPILDLGPATAAQWKGPNGISNTVVIDNQAPNDATWPDGAGGNPLLKLVALGTYNVVSIDFINATLVDDSRLEWRFVFRDTGVPNIAAGEYLGVLAFRSVTDGPGLAALVRATVT
jgi:hypothetical protein